MLTSFFLDSFQALPHGATNLLHNTRVVVYVLCVSSTPGPAASLNVQRVWYSLVMVTLENAVVGSN